MPPEDKGLTIGGFELAWLADLVMSFLLEKINKDLLDELKYFGIYGDDGFGVFDGQQDAFQISSWLTRLQNEVDAIGGNDFLQFTATVWCGQHSDARSPELTSVLRGQWKWKTMTMST